VRRALSSLLTAACKARYAPRLASPSAGDGKRLSRSGQWAGRPIFGPDGPSLQRRGVLLDGGKVRVVTRVLVIDDEASIRLLCRINLEADGMDVLEAADGLGGLELAREQRPDVVLLDVRMPRLDGWQVAEQLLGDERTSEIPIVFLTARVEVRDGARGLDIGGVDFLTKPFNPLELASRVRDLIERGERDERDELRGEKLATLRSLVEPG